MVSRGGIIKTVMKKTGRQYSYVAEIYDAIFDTIKENLVDGNDVFIKEFAKFLVICRGEHLGRNPKTDEVELFPPTRNLRCKLSKNLKRAVKGEKTIVEDDTYEEYSEEDF